VHDILKTDESLCFGITRVNETVIAGRLLATGAEHLFAVLKRIEKFASIQWNVGSDQKQIVVTKQTAIV
jgi:hypothetical protein